MAQPTSLADRLLSLDAYRGFIMLMMVSAEFGMQKLRSDPTWGWLANQFKHEEWEGCTFWDLIQPAFMFMVGVAMPLAFAKRSARGESWGQQFTHVVERSLILILIGVVMDSFTKDRVTIQFIRVLQQIAIGYFLAFLVLHRGPRGQAIAAVLFLVGHTLAYQLYGSDNGDPWKRDFNIGSRIDHGIHGFFSSLGLSNVWPPSTGGYVVINAISATATILFGVLAGELIRSRLPRKKQALILVIAGVIAIVAGLVLELVVPMVKRIWTASFALYAAGWTSLMMAFFYAVIDMYGYRRWSFIFMVVGVNSIFIYVSSGILTPTIKNLLKPFTSGPFGSFGPAWEPVATAIMVVTVQWLLCYWLYRQRIFFKV